MTFTHLLQTKIMSSDGLLSFPAPHPHTRNRREQAFPDATSDDTARCRHGLRAIPRQLFSEIYDAGFLASADVLDCSASDIIGPYVGQTGPKVRQMLDKALGKVLLIDEAYRLAEAYYAKEALDKACMKEKYRKRQITVLAGYEDNINRLLDTNPGMSSRFPEVLDFYGLNPKD
ncbi:hypothetical protein LIA77_00022 [Sarocladium implicatum]|nr:hypothetical protein LIA77_00022 [Sarocladium implicatum]